MAHKDIKIPFEIDGHKFEAVGFLENKEDPVLFSEVQNRTASELGGAICGEEEEFISAHRNKLPEKLQEYCLATRQMYNSTHDMVHYVYLDKSWKRIWRSQRTWWDERFLVLRRAE